MPLPYSLPWDVSTVPLLLHVLRLVEKDLLGRLQCHRNDLSESIKASECSTSEKFNY